jgi:disulfide bond formation protein DsbB
MKRMILALLALIGLVAQPATLQARGFGGGAAQVGTLAGVQVQAQKLAAHSEVSAQPKAEIAGQLSETLVSGIATTPTPLVATVFIKVDRSRE